MMVRFVANGMEDHEIRYLDGAFGRRREEGEDYTHGLRVTSGCSECEFGGRMLPVPAPGGWFMSLKTEVYRPKYGRA